MTRKELRTNNVNKIVSRLKEGYTLEMVNKTLNKVETIGTSEQSFIIANDILFTPELKDFFGSEQEFINYISNYTFEYINIIASNGIVDEIEKIVRIEYTTSDLF